MEQICKVLSGEWDGDSFGNEWPVHYVLYRTTDDSGGEFHGRECFDLYSDDGAGNGDFIARGHNLIQMRSLTLRLGEFVEWEKAA